MRTVVMVCLGFALGGCLGATYQGAATDTEQSMTAPVVATANPWSKRESAAKARNKELHELHQNKPPQGAAVSSKGGDLASGNGCAANLKTEVCRLQHELQMARAATLKVEGHTPKEIATIMSIKQEIVLELLTSAGVDL